MRDRQWGALTAAPDELDVLGFDIIIYIYVLIVANNWLF